MVDNRDTGRAALVEALQKWWDGEGAAEEFSDLLLPNAPQAAGLAPEQ